MSNRTTILDELTETGKALIACGERLIRATAFILNPPEPDAPEPDPEEPAPAYTKEAIRTLLTDLSRAGFREEAKALVRKFANGGSFSDIDPAKYPELAEEAKQYHA